MQRGGRIGDVSDYSASRFRGRLASRAAQTRQAVDDQLGEGMFYAGDEYAGDEVTSGPYTGVDDPDADAETRQPLEELRLNQTAYTVGEFTSWSRSGDMDMDQPYQRGHVWGVVRQRNLIRSLLMGLPIGAITINRRDLGGFKHPGWDENRRVAFAIVDGKQRVTTLLRFVEGRLTVPAWWFPAADRRSSADEVTFTDLSAARQRFFKRLPLACSEARLSSLAAEKDVFDLINFGGVAQGDVDADLIAG